jgi:perosamine synthetase
MDVMIPLSKPDISEKEVEYVSKVLRSGMLSLGPRLKEFEERFADFVGSRYAVALNSGTSALHLCVRALGIGVGDAVITTSFSFVASVNCFLYEGAVPIFVDIDPQTLNLSATQIERYLRECCRRNSAGRMTDKISGRVVKAILPVHVFGVPCDMNSIQDLGRAYRLSVLEDACEALGAKSRGRGVGTMSDAACFAFYPNKQMTTGEGGMVVTNNEAIARACRSMRNQGRDDDSGWLRHVRLGFNYRLSDIHCALGLAQLERIEELLKKRQNVASAYGQALANIPGLMLPKDRGGDIRSWFVYVVRVGRNAGSTARDRILQRLRSRGIGCQAYFPAIHRQPYMRDVAFLSLGPLSQTEAASDCCLALPFFSTLRQEQIDFIAEELGHALQNEPQLSSETASLVATRP